MSVSRPSRLLAVLTALAAIGSPPRAADASGAWTTFVRPYTCTDLLAESGDVWIATGEAGLLRYDRALSTFTPYTREPGGLASNGLTSLALDGTGRLWVGTVGQGVSRLSANRASWDLVNAFDGLLSDSVTVLEADGDTLWIGTTKGLVLWNGREVAGTVPDGINTSPFASDHITGVVVLGDTLLVSTPAGVYLSRLSTNLAAWTPVNGGLITTNVSTLASGGGEVFALASAATFRWNRSTGVWNFVAGNGSVRRLRDDFGGITSVSSLGIFRWNGSAWSLVTATPASDGSPDGGLEPALDATGAGFAASGPVLFEQASPTWASRVFPRPPGNDVQNVAAQGDTVYVATFREGIGRLRDGAWRNWDPDTCTVNCDSVFRSSEFTFALMIDPAGVKWFGCWSAAVSRLDDSGPTPAITNVRITTDVFPADRHTFAWSSATDRNGGRWFGMDTPDRGGLPAIGLDVYDAAGTYVHSYAPGTPGLNDGQIRALSVDKNGLMWIGYAGKGLDVATLPATLGDPLVIDDIVATSTVTLDVFGVVAHGDSIWVLSTDGLRRLRRTDRTVSPSTPFYSIPAAPSARGAVRPLAVAADGTVYVATGDGVRVYRPGGGTTDLKAENSPLASNDVRAVCVDPATGAIWFGTNAGVNRYDPGYAAPPPPQVPRLLVSVYPNPIRLTGIGIELRLTGNAASYDGTVHDLSGREVRRFVGGANGRIVWDGRAQDGELVRPGVYFVRVRGGGREAVARVAVLR